MYFKSRVISSYTGMYPAMFLPRFASTAASAISRKDRIRAYTSRSRNSVLSVDFGMFAGILLRKVWESTSSFANALDDRVERYSSKGV